MDVSGLEWQFRRRSWGSEGPQPSDILSTAARVLARRLGCALEGSTFATALPRAIVAI